MGKKRKNNEAPESPVMPKRSQRISREPPRDFYSTIPTSMGFEVTIAELHELWRHDNVCGLKYMKGCPFRSCTKLDYKAVASLGPEGGIDEKKMATWKPVIATMWKNAGKHFEIFKTDEEKGYRLRVRVDGMFKPVNHEKHPVDFGWIAKIPPGLALNQMGMGHVFNRSSLEPPKDITKSDHTDHLGGPVSFLNCCSKNTETKVEVSTGLSHTVCRILLCGSFASGSELMWDYGLLNKEDVKEPWKLLHPWFYEECCRESFQPPVNEKRHELYSGNRETWFKEKCVLCGYEYSISNRENRVQRKQHLIGSHSDYLGRGKNDCGVYHKSKVVDLQVVLEAGDRLNQLLTALKVRNWTVTPACVIFTKKELETYKSSHNRLMNEFSQRRELLKKSGVLVLHGCEVPSKWEHFQQIPPHNWKDITWKDKKKPRGGYFGVLPVVREKIKNSLLETVKTLTL